MTFQEKTRILVAIDDTDELYGVGTGQLAQRLAETIEEKGWGKCWPITRHQLYVHPDIPYTSHNSAMCFAAEVLPQYIEPLLHFAASFLRQNSAAVADPGLCVVQLDKLHDHAALIAFGKKAKKAVLKKEEAYNLAQKLKVHLSEHGGSGQGVIGALAGTGLRLSGNDGRFKGKHLIETLDGVAKVKDILHQAPIDEVRVLEGETLGCEERVILEGKVKSVLLDGKSVLLVMPIEDETKTNTSWINLPREKLQSF